MVCFLLEGLKFIMFLMNMVHTMSFPMKLMVEGGGRRFGEEREKIEF